MDNFDTLVEGILAGEYDDCLDGIRSAIQTRKENKAAVKQYTIREGDQVRVSRDIRPEYLGGLTAVVVKMNRKTAEVNFDNPSEAGRFSRGCRMPLTYIEKIS